MGNDSSKKSGSHNTEASSTNLKRKGISVNFKTGPSSSTVQKHIDNAQKSRVLQLRNCNLKNLPEQLFEVTEILRNLDLSQNCIRSLPSTIGTFVNLKQLHLSNNELSALPDDIGLLKKLEVLSLDNNELSTLPDGFVGLSSLAILKLSHNKFVDFPKVVCHLASLDNLDMSSNLVEQLPDQVTLTIFFRRLISYLVVIQINLNQNRLNSLNENLICCRRLRTLRVEENCLKKTDFTENFLTNSTVSLITFGGNLFQDKDFQDRPGYYEYQNRYTATKRKM
uniref:Leucine-rich repeat-containing protein 40 n=1 Tax=Syphacia muris TaxID=451379 RepID=A0A0N5AV00_9BILA